MAHIRAAVQSTGPRGLWLCDCGMDVIKPYCILRPLYCHYYYFYYWKGVFIGLARVIIFIVVVIGSSYIVVQSIKFIIVRHNNNSHPIYPVKYVAGGHTQSLRVYTIVYIIIYIGNGQYLRWDIVNHRRGWP